MEKIKRKTERKELKKATTFSGLGTKKVYFLAIIRVHLEYEKRAQTQTS